MRLIDADEYKKQLSVGWMFYTGEDEGKADCFASAMDDLDDMPTIDAEPVIHAHWEKQDEGYYDEGYYEVECSHCKEAFGIEPGSDAKLVIGSYCPHCGAKMDEEA